ncbi:hypothetical protein N665_0317s0032 [Sinapis alba]|nr:hypothetical protein N665_0317s0032 [Sinapis alba]
MAGGEEKTLTTPKEIIHHKFGVKASYRIEEVHVSSQSSCLYRCHLQLPDFSVVSNVFKSRQDSEQSAAELALEKLGILPQDGDDDDHITVEEGWDGIVERIKYIFSDEFLSTDHPLGSHLRATLQMDGERCGLVPVSAIATFDSKINSLCKVINPSTDSDPVLAMSYVMKAAAKLSDYIVVSPHAASLQRKNPYPAAIVEGLAPHVESTKVEAVHIKCTKRDEEVVERVILDISSDRYYLDIIAEKLGLKDGSQVMISRAISKTFFGYECRLYSTIPNLTSSNDFKISRNAKASFVCGQDIHGDAIFASVGYTWRSHDLEHEDVTLKSFYRICCGMSPNGIYKISRKALIAAQLPLLFTRESNWRGPIPKEILCMFCHQQQLAEPVFTISTAPAKSMSDLLSSYNKVKDDSDNQYLSRGEEEMPGSEEGYRCEVKILSKSHDLVLDCSLKKLYEKENDAIQNAALKALSWFSMFFGDMDVESLEACYTNDDLDIQFKQRNRFKETFPSSRVYELPEIIRKGDWYKSRSRGMPWEEKRVQNIANGSLVSICYSVYLKKDAEFSKKGKSLKELVESNEGIEFEVGHGSMNPHLESVVTQMSVGQYVRFSTGLPAEGLVLAAANDTVKALSLLSDYTSLEYSVLLLGVKVPTEERMEKANIVEKVAEDSLQLYRD